MVRVIVTTSGVDRTAPSKSCAPTIARIVARAIMELVSAILDGVEWTAGS